MSSIADIIWRGMQEGILATDDLPEMDVDTGQALQLEMLDRYIDRGETLAGYKVGLTSGAARDAFGEGVRPFGYILQSRVLPDNSSIALTDVMGLGLENELVFRLGSDLSGPDINAIDARNAIAAVAPAFEINQNRIKGRVSAGIRVAENLSQWGLVCGAFVSPDISLDDLSVRASRDGELIEEVSGKGHIDDHFESIATLGRALYQLKRPLTKDMLVITGSYTRFPVTLPGVYKGDFGPPGTVCLTVR